MHKNNNDKENFKWNLKKDLNEPRILLLLGSKKFLRKLLDLEMTHFVLIEF